MSRGAAAGQQVGPAIHRPPHPCRIRAGRGLFVPADFTIVARLDLPEDEGPEANDPLHNGWALPGVPLNSLTLAAAGGERLVPAWEEWAFPECASCDNRGSYQAMLDGDAQELRALFEAARVAWQRTRQTWLAGGPELAEQQVRAAALPAASVEDVRRIVQGLAFLFTNEDH